MKTLLLIRHAKSSWDHPGLPDFERPLNKRGNRDAPFMGSLLKKKNIIPDLIISSPATRAIATARLFAKSMDYSLKKISTDTRLYDAGLSGIKDVISSVDDSIDTLMIVSHNPELTEAAEHLSGVTVDNIVTSAIFCIEFDIDSWKKVNKKSAKVKFYEYPKKYSI